MSGSIANADASQFQSKEKLGTEEHQSKGEGDFEKQVNLSLHRMLTISPTLGTSSPMNSVTRMDKLGSVDKTSTKRSNTQLIQEIGSNVFELPTMKRNTRVLSNEGFNIVKFSRSDSKVRKKRKKFDRSRSVGFQHVIDTEQMTIPGQFILLFAANIFLSNDFEYSLKILEKDLSFVDNTTLFEANVLRYRSMAAE